MFERPHHQRIAEVLRALDGRFLLEAECYFGGGTAIALQLGEYRESVDIDFLCASTSGYRRVREAVFTRGFPALTTQALVALRELKTDQYGIRTFVEMGGVPIKFEIVREARIALTGGMSTELAVPLLSREDLFAEKLLANVDRANDRATFNRDAIDLGIMVSTWGAVPEPSFAKAELAYGPAVRAALHEATRRLAAPEWLTKCAAGLSMSLADGQRALASLESLARPE